MGITINGLTAAVSVVAGMQFETDISGTTSNKVTAAQISTYVNNNLLAQQNTFSQPQTFSSSIAAGQVVPTGSTIPTDTGLYLPATGQIGLAASNKLQLVAQLDPDPNFPGTSGTVYPYVKIGGHRVDALAADGSVIIMAYSADIASVSMRLTAQGPAGGIHHICNGYINMNVGDGGQTSDHCTYVNIVGGPTATSPAISAQKTYPGDSNAFGLNFYTQGTGNFKFYSDNTSVQLFEMARVASGVNYLSAGPGATGNSPYIESKGSDTNVGFNLITKGTGGFGLFTNSTVRQLSVIHVASAVNYVRLAGAATGNNVTFDTEGSDTNIGVNYSTKGSGAHNFYTNASAQRQLQITHTASAVNYYVMTGSATGQPLIIQATGSDTNISNRYNAKGTGSHAFYTGGGLQVQYPDTANAVNYFNITGASTGNSPSLSSQGEGTVGMTIYTAGSGNIEFYTGNTAAHDFSIAHVANAANYLQVSGSASSGGVATLSAIGADSNIDLALTPKGTGVLKFGTRTAIGAETVTGFITIKDSGGTSRKLAVVS